MVDTDTKASGSSETPVHFFQIWRRH